MSNSTGPSDSTAASPSSTDPIYGSEPADQNFASSGRSAGSTREGEPVSAGESTENVNSQILPGEENLSEEERQEIFSQIDQVASRSRLDERRGNFEFTPNKNGGFFPLLINILALLAIAGGVYYADYFYSRQEEQLDVQSDSYLSAEGKIIEEYKKESERKLSEKENEIQDIQQDLEKIKEERQELATHMEQRIDEREEELRTELEAEIREEQERLEAQGISEEELENRLSEIRKERREELESRLEGYRDEMQAELEEKQQELAEAEETAQQILDEARQEKENLIEESQQREEELREQMEEQKERLSQQAGQAQEKLSELSEQRQQEQLILDQISSLYLDIRNALSNNETQKAMERISALRELINSPNVVQMSALSKRREVDTFLLSTIEEYINKTQRSSGESSLLETAQLLSSAKASVSSAQEALEKGDRYTAERYFNQALTTIPAIETAHNEVRQIEGEKRGERVEELISLAEEQREEGNMEEAVSKLATAAAEASPFNSGKAREAVRKLNTMLTESYESTIEENRQEFEARREELRSRINELTTRLDRVNAELEKTEKTLAEREQELEDEVSSLESRLNKLQEENNEADTRIKQLETRITEGESKQEELEEEKRRLEGRVEDLRTQLSKVEANYKSVQKRNQRLERDLDEAAEEMAEMVAGSGGNTTLSEAVDRYSDFRETQRELLSTGDAETQNKARKNFEDFLRSEAISSIFPDLPSLYDRSHSE